MRVHVFCRESGQLVSVLQQIVASDLGQTTQPAWQMYKVLVSAVCPAPYIREDCARAHLHIMDLLAEADLHGKGGAVQDASEVYRVRFAIEAGSEVVAMVLQVLAKLRMMSQDSNIGRSYLLY